MKIEVYLGDITKLKVDAIVNAANSSLMGGGGVDGAIHRAGGRVILEECMAIRERQGGCPTGEAVITSAGMLPSQYVIHTVGPVWRGGENDEADKLKNCYTRSLALAQANSCKVVAFPNISTGVYGYPIREAAEIAISAVRDHEFLGIEKVIFVCFEPENYEQYEEILRSEE